MKEDLEEEKRNNLNKIALWKKEQLDFEHQAFMRKASIKRLEKANLAIDEQIKLIKT
jgi:hypothetical protein